MNRTADHRAEAHGCRRRPARARARLAAGCVSASGPPVRRVLGAAAGGRPSSRARWPGPDALMVTAVATATKTTAAVTAPVTSTARRPTLLAVGDIGDCRAGGDRGAATAAPRATMPGRSRCSGTSPTPTARRRTTTSASGPRGGPSRAGSTPSSATTTTATARCSTRTGRARAPRRSRGTPTPSAPGWCSSSTRTARRRAARQARPR